jgi:peptidoglycan/LPS O-acetylase OafA/YrhL
MPIESYPRGKLAGVDGLRAIAVLLVLLFHNDILLAGWVGVQIFFVLSGYLITRLLFQSREAPLRTYLRDFYGRRALRIFPLYFSVLALIAIADGLGLRMQGVREGLPFAFTYTYNFFHASSAFVHSRLLSHFWSLSVEEQFYLVWPFVIYFCPRSALRSLLFALSISGMPLRGLEWYLLRAFPNFVTGRPDIALYVLTPSHLDAFAMGGYVSLFPVRRALPAVWGAAALLFAGGGAVFYFSGSGLVTPTTLGYPIGLWPCYAFIWGYTLLNACSAFLIDCIAHQKLAPAFFDWKAFRFIGKVSYGFYVIHYPVQSLLTKVIPWNMLALKIVVQLTVTTALASASYYWMETRFLALKDRWFPSERAQTVREGVILSSAGPGA